MTPIQDDSTLLLALGWTGYFTLHSVLASEGVKRTIRNSWPALFGKYRIVYNLLALVLLVPLVRWTLGGSEFLVPRGWMLESLAILLIIASGYVFYRVIREMDVSEFLGLASEGKEGEGKLLTTGIYAHVRHPLYFATLLLFTGLLIWLSTAEMAITTVAVVIYLVIGSRLEERKLIARFGEQYLTYRCRVKSLIPYVF